MIVAVTLSLFLAWEHLRPQYRVIKFVPRKQLWTHNASAKDVAKRGDFRLYLNGKATNFFEPGSVDTHLGVWSIERKGLKKAYLVSNVTSDGGAIMTWYQSYLYWDGHRLSLVHMVEGDPLEFHPDGRLLVMQSLSVSGQFRNMDNLWESDRGAFLVWKGKSYNLGGAVNLWFEKDDSIRGISNGNGDDAAPHFFTYRNGVRRDEPVQPSALKRTGKRLYPVKGGDDRY